MIYPKALTNNSTVGICAPSAGVGHKLNSFEKSLQVLKQQEWKIWETEHVRVDNLRGGSAQERAQELMSLMSLDAVDAVMCASGGDFLSEILPYLDWKLLGENPKWVMGSSDPTGILFPLTTICDIATLYGSNAGSFDATVLSETGEPVLPEYLCKTLSFLKGDLPVQQNYEKYIGSDIFQLDDGPFMFDRITVYLSDTRSLKTKGRCIGGCIDVLKDLIGTRYDATKEFIQRYEKDGFIWYFDNFALSSATLYRTFLQMRYAGWITPETTRAILIGRTLFEKEESEMTYDDAVQMAFPDIPVIREMDIGHTVPHFAMINGAMLNLDWDGNTARLNFELV